MSHDIITPDFYSTQQRYCHCVLCVPHLVQYLYACVSLILLKLIVCVYLLANQPRVNHPESHRLICPGS